jgi:hypothetical protein
MLGSAIANSVNAAIDTTDFAKTEAFSSESGLGGSPARLAFVSIVTVFIMLSLVLFAGKYLWNTVLVSLVPAIKPAKSVFQILGLAILIMLMSPGGCNCS